MLPAERAHTSQRITTKIGQLPNLGPKSAAMLASVGITTLTELRERGVITAYVEVKREYSSVSLNLLYALVAALEGSNWKIVQRERKLELMLAVADQQRAHRG